MDTDADTDTDTDTDPDTDTDTDTDGYDAIGARQVAGGERSARRWTTPCTDRAAMRDSRVPPATEGRP